MKDTRKILCVIGLHGVYKNIYIFINIHVSFHERNTEGTKMSRTAAK